MVIINAVPEIVLISYSFKLELNLECNETIIFSLLNRMKSLFSHITHFISV